MQILLIEVQSMYGFYGKFEQCHKSPYFWYFERSVKINGKVMMIRSFAVHILVNTMTITKS